MIYKWFAQTEKRKRNPGSVTMQSNLFYKNKRKQNKAKNKQTNKKQKYNTKPKNYRKDQYILLDKERFTNSGLEVLTWVSGLAKIFPPFP